MTWSRRQFSRAVTSLGFFGLIGCNDSAPPPDFGAPGTPSPSLSQSSEEAYAEQQRQEKEQAKKKQ